MKPSSCAQFERWLDEGSDTRAGSAMREHANHCTRCAAASAAMAEVDALLSAPSVAPAGFADAVMARVEHIAPIPAPLLADALPWWMGILQQPAVVLASLVVALLIWRSELLLTGVASASNWLAQAAYSLDAAAAGWSASLASLTVTGFGEGASSTLTVGIAVGLAPILVIASMTLSAWVARRVTRWTLAG